MVFKLKELEEDSPGIIIFSHKEFVKYSKYKTVCPILNPGDAIFHHCEIIHGSSENTSGKRRRGLTFQFKDMNSKFDNKMKKKYILSLKKQIRKRKETS